MTTVKIDKIEKLSCGSLIQHGPFNDRIYLMKFGEKVSPQLPGNLLNLAEENGYTKIFAKVRAEVSDLFSQQGFSIEATIPGFFNGKEDAHFMGYYLEKSRAIEKEAQQLNDTLKLAQSKSGSPVKPYALAESRIRACNKNDLIPMTEIYRVVFPTYPFPIHDPDYIHSTMKSNVDYFGVQRENELIALSSAEMDIESSTVEMTDFATLPNSRGHGLAAHLLIRMEEEMKKKGIITAYTIARAISPGMNITFSKLGYNYGGRLKNNTNISGNIESMNIWYKPLGAR